MILRILAGSMVALGLGLIAEGAHAGQTFVCNDGRLLQVEQKDVERLKRKDPCIAAHFGLTVQLVPLPVQRPEGKVVASSLKGAQTTAIVRRNIGNLAQAFTDYRKVRIINARPGNGRWFNHTY